ncbi:hypothetical protein OS190_13740 [Sulfitobacter sp. F26204]|uniref:hypothetical protein n=1 Tax=Sulfitobacter sp. F26204 TaxID=2996014 RepID=UPI00225E51D9|nr:hypothetical protein [Sulfitobacter sp. F26204]MCX7560635.1 hypothetical protein [Sulfitobacter sp. F26204]
MTRFAPGDIVELQTDAGLAYVQLTHQHPSYPPVIKALRGLFKTRPADVSALLDVPPAFVAMIPLESVVDRLGLKTQVVAQVALPASARAFPTFRMPIRDKQGAIVYWWYWDGEGLHYDVNLEGGHEEMPQREVLGAQQFLLKLTQTTAPC